MSAKDKGQWEQSIRASTLDKTEVERMVKQAEQNAAVDKSVVKIDRKNQADSLAYQAEKQLSDLGDKVPADKTKVEGWSKTCGRLSLRTTMSGSRHSCLNCNRLCLLSAATSINKVVAVRLLVAPAQMIAAPPRLPAAAMMYDADFTETK